MVIRVQDDCSKCAILHSFHLWSFGRWDEFLPWDGLKEQNILCTIDGNYHTTPWHTLLQSINQIQCVYNAFERYRGQRTVCELPQCIRNFLSCFERLLPQTYVMLNLLSSVTTCWPLLCLVAKPHVPLSGHTLTPVQNWWIRSKNIIFCKNLVFPSHELTMSWMGFF